MSRRLNSRSRFFSWTGGSETQRGAERRNVTNKYFIRVNPLRLFKSGRISIIPTILSVRGTEIRVLMMQNNPYSLLLGCYH